MSQVYKNGILYIDDEPVIHEGSDGYAEMQQLCWVQVGDKRVIRPITTRVYAKDLENLSGVTVMGHRIATIESFFSKSYGDEATDCGVKSGTRGGPAHFISASPTVTINGVPVVRRGDLIIANNGNSEPGAWQDSPPGAPSFADKLVSTPLDVTKPIEKVRVSIGVAARGNDSMDTLPFRRAILVESTDGAVKQYRQTTGVTVKDEFLTFEVPANGGPTFVIKECLNDPFGGLYEVEQGEILPQPSNTPGDIVLAAVDFRVLQAVNHDVRFISWLYRGSWMYLFKDGYLWREFLHVQRHKNICEVNLHEHAGKDVRPTNIMIERGILMNIRGTLGRPRYGYVVSLRQWSWAQIEAMGGVYPGKKSPEIIEAQQRRITSIDTSRLFNDTQGGAPSETPVMDPETHICNDGIAWIGYPEEQVPENMHPREVLYKTPHPAVAVMYLKDPFGNAVGKSMDISNRYNEHMDFLYENEDLYHAAPLVGGVLDAFEKQGKNYRKHVRDEERVAHMAMYEETLKAYEQYMEEATGDLIEYIKQADAIHAWDNFDKTSYNGETPNYQLGLAQHWTQLGFALSQSEKGRMFFGDLLMDDSSPLQDAMNLLKKYAFDRSMRDIILAFGDIFASVAAIREGGMEKFVDWFNHFIPDIATLQVVETSLESLVRAQSQQYMTIEPHSSVYGVTAGRLERLMYSSGSTKTTDYAFNSTERMRRESDRSRRLGNIKVKVLTWNGQLVQKIAVSMQDGSAVMRTFLAMSAMNTISVLCELERKQPNMLSSDWWWIYGELAASLAETLSYIPKASGESLRHSLKHHWARPPKGGLRFMGPIANVLVFVFDWKGILHAIDIGDDMQTTGYGLSVTGALIEGIIFISRRSLVSLMFGVPRLYLLAITIGIIGTAVVLLFTKNEWEEWLFLSPWGKSDKHIRSYEESAKKMLTILNLIHFVSLRYKDESLYRLIPLQEVVREEEYVYPRRPWVKHVHEKLQHSAIRLKLYLQKMEGMRVAVQVLSSDIDGNETPVPVDKPNCPDLMYEEEGMVSCIIDFLPSILPKLEKRLLVSVDYHLLDGENHGVLESRLYAIRYDIGTYEYVVDPLSTCKNEEG